MFRDNIRYRKLISKFDRALRRIGLDDNLDVDNLIGKVDVSGLEDLMMTSYRIMKYIRVYLRQIGCKYEQAHKVTDLYTSLHFAILATTGKQRTLFLADEADKMEKLSRAAYAWLKASRMLKPSKRVELPEINLFVHPSLNLYERD